MLIAAPLIRWDPVSVMQDIKVIPMMAVIPSVTATQIVLLTSPVKIKNVPILVLEYVAKMHSVGS